MVDKERGAPSWWSLMTKVGMGTHLGMGALGHQLLLWNFAGKQDFSEGKVNLQKWEGVVTDPHSHTHAPNYQTQSGPARLSLLPPAGAVGHEGPTLKASPRLSPHSPTRPSGQPRSHLSLVSTFQTTRDKGSWSVHTRTGFFLRPSYTLNLQLLNLMGPKT